jgi:hypothetical protein
VRVWNCGLRDWGRVVPPHTQGTEPLGPPHRHRLLRPYHWSPVAEVESRSTKPIVRACKPTHQQGRPDCRTGSSGSLGAPAPMSWRGTTNCIHLTHQILPGGFWDYRCRCRPPLETPRYGRLLSLSYRLGGAALIGGNCHWCLGSNWPRSIGELNCNEIRRVRAVDGSPRHRRQSIRGLKSRPGLGASRRHKTCAESGMVRPGDSVFQKAGRRQRIDRL